MCPAQCTRWHNVRQSWQIRNIAFRIARRPGRISVARVSARRLSLSPPSYLLAYQVRRCMLLWFCEGKANQTNPGNGHWSEFEAEPPVWERMLGRCQCCPCVPTKVCGSGCFFDKDFRPVPRALPAAHPQSPAPFNRKTQNASCDFLTKDLDRWMARVLLFYPSAKRRPILA